MATINLKRLPRAAKVGVGALACVLVGVAYYATIDSDISAGIERESSTKSNLESELAKAKEAQQTYFADKEEFATRQQKQRELNKVLPVEAEPATFLSAIQTVSNVSGVDLKAWSPLEEVPQAFFAKVPMKLTLSGRFHQIAKFLYEVGKQERIINMENLEVTDPKVEGEEVTLKATCLATSFHVLKPKAPAAKPGAAAPAAGGSK